jgi:ubiquitin-like protein Pup
VPCAFPGSRRVGGAPGPAGRRNEGNVVKNERQARSSSRPDDKAAEATEVAAGSKDAQRTSNEEIDALLDEIDETLGQISEQDAQFWVDSFVQKGGQ